MPMRSSGPRSCSPTCASARGRLFLLGVGGSAANCSHAVNDFRKICGIEAYAPTDNVSELTARTNDEGWATVFVEWLKVSRLSRDDMLFIFSVGGGNVEKNISPNLVAALEYAKRGRREDLSASSAATAATRRQVADACVIIPTVNPQNVTPHTEAFQAVVWHLLVSHPALKAAADEVGIDASDETRRVSRSRRRHQSRRRARRQAVSAAIASTSWKCCRRRCRSAAASCATPASG